MSFSYTSSYGQPSLHGIDSSTPRPWDLRKEVIKYSGKHVKLLDIGCGTASKLIPLSPYFGEITGIDISLDMINSAKENIKNHSISNIKLIHGNSSNLPFEDNTFDIVTCMLSRWEAKEIYRVLKPKGAVIIEHIGCEDKKEFKLLFGKDQDGWRGQFIDFQRDEYLQNYQKLFDNFDAVDIKNGFWKTIYTEDGIIELLKHTPTVRNFDSKKDGDSLKTACRLFKSNSGIELTQNRILIHAKKP